MKKILLVCLILSLSMFGCGSDSGTSGTLNMSEISLTDLNGSQGVTATATYIPEGGKNPQGVSIHFEAIYTTTTINGNLTYTSSQDRIVASDGIATYEPDVVVQGSDPVTVRMTASYKGLSKTKLLSIPNI